MKRFPGFCATFILLAGMFTISASAQITPSDDSYILTSSPTLNFGAKNALVVQGPGATAFIRFDLSSLPSGLTSDSLAKATLKVYVSAVTSAGTFDVDRVTSAWTEKTLDARTEPTIGSTVASAVPVTIADKYQYLLVDVTAAVGEWLNGSANDGIALVPDGTISLSINSKETTTTSHPPELDVVLRGLQGPTGPAGPVSGVTAGAGLAGGGTKGNVTLSLLTSCASGQILQWNGTTWTCATASGLTSIAHDTALTGTGTVSTPLGIAAPMTLSATSGTPTITGTNTGTGAGILGQVGNSFPAVLGNNTGTGQGVQGSTPGTINGTGGVYGFAGNVSGIVDPPAGVVGDSSKQYGVLGLSTFNAAVVGVSANASGVVGQVANKQPAVQGNNTGAGHGVQGSIPGTTTGTGGVYGIAGAVSGITQPAAGVVGDSKSQYGVLGKSSTTAGVVGVSTAASGVVGQVANSFPGVQGNNTAGGSGVQGISVNGTGVYGGSSNGFGMVTNTSVQQARSGGGWVKAMAYVGPDSNGNYNILRCYNSQANGATVSTAPCGFNFAYTASGFHYLDFGFQINDRFLLANPDGTGGAEMGLTFTLSSASQLFVYTYYLYPASRDGQPTDTGFYVFVF